MKSRRFGMHKISFRRPEGETKKPLIEKKEENGERKGEDEKDEEDEWEDEEDDDDKDDDDKDDDDKDDDDKDDDDKDDDDKDDDDKDDDVDVDDDEDYECRWKEKEPTQEEQLASVVAKEEDHGSDGEDCELHVYEIKFDSRGEQYTLRAGTRFNIQPPKPKSCRACLVLNRVYTRTGDVSYTQLEIQSRHIIKGLRDVIGTYPGVDFATYPVSIREPPRCLYHYQDEIWRYAEASEDEQEKSHLKLCLQYMEKSLHREIKISKSSKSPELECRDLWIVFKPGCLIYETDGGNQQLSRLWSIREERDSDMEIESWTLSTDRIRYRGKGVGFTSEKVTIEQYSGCTPICELAAMPLHLHPEEEKIRCDLLKRGRRYLSLGGIHHCYYEGVLQECKTRVSNGRQTNVKHRIMLDVKHFADAGHFILNTKDFPSGLEASADLSDEDIMTCSPNIPGYSLELNRWAFFLVTGIAEVAYNDEAFHGLVLQERKKRLIFSLLERQDREQHDDFDDLIRGKGKGLIFLLHGPPGVGKTYTAESIADHTRRPLLKAQAADVYGSGALVERQLSEFFSLAIRWDGILLLDEADVYMQDRATQDLNANQLVSTFLRILEYYEGILFLTTNREHTIDPAFRSRIHLFIAYPPLSADARRQLWLASITRACRGQTPEWLSTQYLDHLVEQDINGRQIKNVVRVGYSLARSERREMNNEDLLQGLYALKQDETDSNRPPEQEEARKTIATT